MNILWHEDSEEEIKQNLHNQLKTHRKYLKPEQVEILEDLYKLDILNIPTKHLMSGNLSQKVC